MKHSGWSGISYAAGAVTFGSPNSSSTDGSYIGGLVGTNSYNANSLTIGTILNSHATGDVTAPGSYIGGLVGYNNGGNIDGSYATGKVSNPNSSSSTTLQYIGGLVGYNIPATTTKRVNGVLVSSSFGGNISNSYATGEVKAPSAFNVGGLVGVDFAGAVSNSYATGNVTGGFIVGGLIGSTVGAQAVVSNSSASGNVTGQNTVGGLIGTNAGCLNNSSASGSVSAVNEGLNGSVGNIAGELVAQNQGAITGSTASGDVVGTDSVGGLVGLNSGTASIANSSATGSVNSGGGSLIGSNTSTGALSGNSYRDAKAEARAAAQLAQTRQAAFSAGNVISNTAEATSKTPPKAAASTASGKAAVAAANPSADVEDYVTGQVSTQTQLPTAARARPRHASATTTSGGHKSSRLFARGRLSRAHSQHRRRRPAFRPRAMAARIPRPLRRPNKTHLDQKGRSSNVFPPSAPLLRRRASPHSRRAAGLRAERPHSLCCPTTSAPPSVEAEEARHARRRVRAATPVLPQIAEPRFTLASKETLFVKHLVVEGPTARRRGRAARNSRAL